MFSKKIVVVLFTSLVFTITQGVTNKDYGEFKFKVASYSIKLPEKAKSVLELDFKVDETNDTFRVTINVRIKKPLGNIGIKTRSYVWNEQLQKFSLSFNMGVKSLCDNRVSKQFLKIIGGLQDYCRAVKVGTYNFAIPDLSAFIHTYLNGKFFYGRYRTLTDIFAEGFGRLATSNVTAVIQPLK